MRKTVAGSRCTLARLLVFKLVLVKYILLSSISKILRSSFTYSNRLSYAAYIVP